MLNNPSFAPKINEDGALVRIKTPFVLCRSLLVFSGKRSPLLIFVFYQVHNLCLFLYEIRISLWEGKKSILSFLEARSNDGGTTFDVHDPNPPPFQSSRFVVTN